jgi:hypothetical protein
MPRTRPRTTLAEHAPRNAMDDAGEVARFHDRSSDLMRALLDELAAAPGRPRPFPAIEDALGWPRRRIASVLGGVAHLRQAEFGGRRPYRFQDERQSASGRWEMWMDAEQARAPCAPPGASSGHRAPRGPPARCDVLPAPVTGPGGFLVGLLGEPLTEDQKDDHGSEPGGQWGDRPVVAIKVRKQRRLG